MEHSLMNIDDTRFQAMAGLTDCGSGRYRSSENFKLSSLVCPVKKKISCCPKSRASLEDDEHLELLTEDGRLDDTDVEYKIFLDHLREDGTSYVLEIINSKNGEMVSLKYEGEDVPCEIDSDSLRTRCGILDEGKGLCPSRNNHKSGGMDSLSDDTDVGYKMFLDHVREDGDSYVLEIINSKDGEMVSLKYEGEDGSPQSNSETLRTNGIFNEGKGMCHGKNNLKSGSLGLTHLRRGGRASKETSKKNVHSSLSDSHCKVGCSFVEEDYHTFIKHLKLDGYSYVLNLKSEDGKLVTVSYEEETVSNTRKRKLAALKKQNLQTTTQSIKLEASNKRKNVCTDDLCQTKCHFGSSNQGSSRLIEKEEKSEEDVYLYEMQAWSERLPVESTLDCSGLDVISNKALLKSSFDSTINKDDGDVIESLSWSNSSNFEKNLTTNLRSPYDHVEHRNLWNEVNRHRPIKRLRILRNRSKSYETEDMGLSYLEYYPDFAKQIKLVSGDRHEALYLLRGFFFWLKNMCHPDAFMPWSRSLDNVENGSDSDCTIVDG